MDDQEQRWLQVGEAIAARLKELDVTTAEFLRKSKLSDKTLARYIGGKPIVRKDKKRDLCAALGWTTDSIERILDGKLPVRTAPQTASGEELRALHERVDAIRAQAIVNRGYELPSDHIFELRNLSRGVSSDDAIQDPQALTSSVSFLELEVADIDFEVRRQFHQVNARLDQIEKALGLTPPEPVDAAQWLPPRLVPDDDEQFALAAEGGVADPGDEGTVSRPSPAPEDDD